MAAPVTEAIEAPEPAWSASRAWPGQSLDRHLRSRRRQRPRVRWGWSDWGPCNRQSFRQTRLPPCLTVDEHWPGDCSRRLACVFHAAGWHPSAQRRPDALKWPISAAGEGRDTATRCAISARGFPAGPSGGR